MWGFSDCRTVTELLWNYTTDKLSEHEIALVERHLSNCGPCRAQADAFRQTVDALASMRRDGIPQSLRGWHEVQARLSAPVHSPILSRERWRLPPLAWGSVAIAAAALIVTFFTNHPSDTRHPSDPTRPDAVAKIAGNGNPELSSDQQEPFDLDYVYGDTSAEPKTGSRTALGHPIRRTPTAL